MTDTTEMNIEKTMEIAEGRYRIGTITEVEPHEGGYTITVEERYGDGPRWEELHAAHPDTFDDPDKTSHCGFSLSNEWGVEPQVGDRIRTFIHGGAEIHGVDINDVEVYYHDSFQQEETRRKRASDHEAKLKREFEESRERLDADYEALPAAYKKRVDKFRNASPDWRWEFEQYEMSCLVDAIKIAQWFRDHDQAPTDQEQETYDAFIKIAQEHMDEMDLFEGHSGNSYSFAVRMAWFDLTDQSVIYYEHGALVHLVGCDGYHCPHPYDPDGRFSEESLASS